MCTTCQKQIDSSLLLPDAFDDNDVLRAIAALFSTLVLADFADRRHGRGRKGYGRHPILRALVLRHYFHIRFITTLRDILLASSDLARLCGFPPGKIPHESVFYRFLKETPNSHLQNLIHQTAKLLTRQGIVPAKILLEDSKPILACTRDNNPKIPNRNLNPSLGPPRRNPQATLSYYSYRKTSTDEKNGKQYTWFWGYRTHAIVSVEGIVLVETTEPNNRTDAKIARKLLKKLKRVYGSQRGKIFIGDAAYDEKELYDLLVHQMKMQAFIPINPRNAKPRTDNDFDQNGLPVCPAGIPMNYVGKCPERNRLRLKFRCAVKTDRHVTGVCQKDCPIHDPRFDGYGCTRYLDVTDDARSRVPRNTPLFKKAYRRREKIEHYFARFGDCEVEKTSHYEYRSIKNQMTLGHLTMNLVAASAVALGHPENIRCRRTFARAG
jgi:hypothetical protein